MHIETGAATIYAEEHGRGEPLLLIHGLGMSHALWTHQVGVFAEHYRTIWVPEFVRQFVLEKGATPEYADVESIARGQLALRDEMAETAATVLVQDTDANGNLLFLTDADGNLILDANGDPIPILVPVTIGPAMNAAGALFSPRFFDLFSPGGSHVGRLTDAELKLISEWNDIGVQYYNDPFSVPP